jgi:hypothetical protein
MTVPTWSELMERLYEASKPHYAKPGDVFEGWDASITAGYEHMNEAAMLGRKDLESRVAELEKRVAALESAPTIDTDHA